MCIEFENLLRSELSSGKFPPPQQKVKFIINGTQAFFFQIVTYRLSGWIGSNEAAEEELAEYITTWLSADFNKSNSNS